jgi:hypothetical protein
MKRENRHLTRAEWKRITSRRPVVRRYSKPGGEPRKRGKRGRVTQQEQTT